MLTHEEISSLDEILQRHNYDSSSVIAVMQDIQRKYRYLPQEALTYIAHELHLSEAKVYGVATFYENFSGSQGQVCHQGVRRHGMPRPQVCSHSGRIPEHPRPVRRQAHFRRYAFYAGDRFLPGRLRARPGMHRQR